MPPHTRRHRQRSITEARRRRLKSTVTLRTNQSWNVVLQPGEADGGHTAFPTSDNPKGETAPDFGKFDSQLTNRTMYSLSVNENLCRWRCLVSDACSEWHQFLAFRGSLPAKREALPGFPSHLVRPFETLGMTTSRHTLRDSGNHNISSDPARL
jgi:hypothetical protein